MLACVLCMGGREGGNACSPIWIDSLLRLQSPTQACSVARGSCISLSALSLHDRACFFPSLFPLASSIFSCSAAHRSRFGSSGTQRLSKGHAYRLQQVMYSLVVPHATEYNTVLYLSYIVASHVGCMIADNVVAALMFPVPIGPSLLNSRFYPSFFLGHWHPQLGARGEEKKWTGRGSIGREKLDGRFLEKLVDRNLSLAFSSHSGGALHARIASASFALAPLTVALDGFLSLVLIVSPTPLITRLLAAIHRQAVSSALCASEMISAKE